MSLQNYVEIVKIRSQAENVKYERVFDAAKNFLKESFPKHYMQLSIDSSKNSTFNHLGEGVKDRYIEVKVILPHKVNAKFRIRVNFSLPLNSQTALTCNFYGLEPPTRNNFFKPKKYTKFLTEEEAFLLIKNYLK